MPAREGSKVVKPVTLPPGRVRLLTMPFPTGSATAEEDDREGAGFCQNRQGCRCSVGDDEIRPGGDDVLGDLRQLIKVRRDMHVRSDVAAPGPSQRLKVLRDIRPVVRAGSETLDPSNPPHPIRSLCSPWQRTQERK